VRDFKDSDAPKPLNTETATTQADAARPLRQQMARMTMGTSPVSTLSLLGDWAMHLATAPDKQASLAQKAAQNWMGWASYVARGCPVGGQPIAPQRGDRRFHHEAWSSGPFAALSQAFLLAEDFVDHATSDIPGLSPEQDRAMTFLARQMMDSVAPPNFLLTNPDAFAQTKREQGANRVRGGRAFFQDATALSQGKTPRPEKVVGKDVATAPGKVVLRSHLMELIQYAPSTETVHPEPILIVPAWIMKYYILDLSPEMSMVNYLTSQGFTVFMISWRNPDAGDAGLGMMDYLAQGPMAALDHIDAATGGARVHGTGYCLGGTLLSIAAAELARRGDDRLASITMLAAQTDFTEAGELLLFINESQVSFLEDLMAEQGYLDATQMTNAFHMLRSNDLIWSRMVHDYLMGEEPAPMNALMSWNADTTRMPAKMHSEYLRSMFLNNDLAAGKYHVDGHAVSLRDIRLPIFAVGTETDHIAPWRSVFKIHNLTHSDVTFALTNGGHNAGVVSQPGHPRRHFSLHTAHDSDPALTPDEWQEIATPHEGSWWPAWVTWLAAQSGDSVAPPKMGKALCDAPGTYVKME